VTIGGDTIKVTGMKLSGADSARLIIRNITPADSTARFPFFTRTGTHPDSLFAITTQPSLYVYSIPLPISTVKLNDVNGVPVRNNTLVTVRGVVRSPTVGGPSTYGQSAGWHVWFIFLVGRRCDEVIVSGLVQPFSGLTEIVNPQLHLLVTSGNVVQPVIVTAAEIRRDGAGGVEVYEGRLVRVNNAHVRGNGAWSANTNYGFVDGTDSTEIRIDASTNLVNAPIPASACDVVGVVGQYITASPYIGGYQLMPRHTGDVMVTGPGIASLPLETDLTSCADH
jgi:hypothetical protein